MKYNVNYKSGESFTRMSCIGPLTPSAPTRLRGELGDTKMMVGSGSLHDVVHMTSFVVKANDITIDSVAEHAIVTRRMTGSSIGYLTDSRGRDSYEVHVYRIEQPTAQNR